jgi:hypothetical protein
MHHVRRLATAVSVTKTVGAAGGVLAIPNSSVILNIPAGALTLPVSITMTALPGDVVAYEFAPHGLVFLKPATLIQRLSETQEKGQGGQNGQYGNGTTTDPVELGYFGISTQIDPLIANLEEIHGGSESGGVFTGSIWHFSGYVVACGRR